MVVQVQYESCETCSSILVPFCGLSVASLGFEASRDRIAIATANGYEMRRRTPGQGPPLLRKSLIRTPGHVIHFWVTRMSPEWSPLYGGSDGDERGRMVPLSTPRTTPGVASSGQLQTAIHMVKRLRALWFNRRSRQFPSSHKATNHAGRISLSHSAPSNVCSVTCVYVTSPYAYNMITTLHNSLPAIFFHFIKAA